MSKALVTLEEAGLACREPGERVNGRRTADRWRPIPTVSTADTSDSPPLSTSNVNDEPCHEGAAHDEAIPPQSTPTPSTGDASTPGTTQPSPENQLTDPDAGLDETGESNPPTEGPGHQPEHAPDTTDAPNAAAAPPGPILTTISGGKKRLAPGSLRQMVIDHLRAHPQQTFTATAISRAIEKSSGAIANALSTLVKQGVAEQVTDKPRTFRLAAADTE